MWLALLIFAMLITLGVLFAGLISMAIGNKLMRYRVLAQGLAIALFALAMFMKG